MAEHHDEDNEYGPTYKSLFLGVCIVLGSAFGWWLTNFISTVDKLHASYESRLTELEAGRREQHLQNEQLQHAVRENSVILRTLEREAVRRPR